MDGHEHGRATGVGQALQAGAGGRVDGEGDLRTRRRLHRGARPVEWEVDDLGISSSVVAQNRNWRDATDSGSDSSPRTARCHNAKSAYCTGNGAQLGSSPECRAP